MESKRIPGNESEGPAITRITLDLRRNTLRLVLVERPVAQRRAIPALIDIGEGGRLLGVELDAFTARGEDPLYLTLFASTGSNVRSVTAAVEGDLDAAGELLAVVVPRRGHGYEIAYPSGNQ